MFKYPDIKKEVLDKAITAEDALKDLYLEIDEICEANQYKVLSAFNKMRVAEEHFNATSGYGYGDIGRQCLDGLYAEIFKTEDALVRSQIICGTQAIYLALSANLLPGDELLYASGSPYDSLEPAIGIKNSPVSLAEYGVSFKTTELKDGRLDLEHIKAAVTEKTKIVAFQRSRGYSLRKSLTPEEIGEGISLVKSVNPKIITFVDNCYGEFVGTKEPSEYGADLIAGSLIKNPGGGLAPGGGYIAGRKDLIERCAYRLTAPGLGKEVGSNSFLKLYFQGLSLAPRVVANALKTAHFLAFMAELYGYVPNPAPFEKHGCIVQAVTFNDPQLLKRFCAEVQHASYVDSFLTPEDWDMPGYADKVVMASGSFISGSSIELSADGPMREPYNVLFQGGLSFEQGKYAVLSAFNNLSG